MSSTLLLMAGCAQTPHTAVDVQLDIDAALPEAAERVRLCVSDGPVRSFGPGDGRYALAGLAPGAAPVVTVQALDGDLRVLGQAGPAAVEQRYGVMQWEETEGLGRCEGEDLVAPEEDAWVLGVRFSP